MKFHNIALAAVLLLSACATEGGFKNNLPQAALTTKTEPVGGSGIAWTAANDQCQRLSLSIALELSSGLYGTTFTTDLEPQGKAREQIGMKALPPGRYVVHEVFCEQGSYPYFRPIYTQRVSPVILAAFDVSPSTTNYLGQFEISIVKDVPKGEAPYMELAISDNFETARATIDSEDKLELLSPLVNAPAKVCEKRSVMQRGGDDGLIGAVLSDMRDKRAGEKVTTPMQSCR